MLINFLKAVFAFFIDFIETAIVALSIFVVIYIFLAQPHQVRGSSMYPNFTDGEYILTNKISYRFENPKRGQVIVFKAPHNGGYDYIKRIIGLPGEIIKISGGKIYINNHLLNEENYLSSDVLTQNGLFLSEGKQFEIPDNEYFVLGDNRSQSSDSRDWGTVPRKNIIGKAWFRYWPINKINFLPEASYPQENQ